jgi:hypothetical protein
MNSRNIKKADIKTLSTDRNCATSGLGEHYGGTAVKSSLIYWEN